MKVISVVGFKKTGKTTLIEALVRSLKRYGSVGTIKHMPGHDLEEGDTGRHLDAGSDLAIGINEGWMRMTGPGNLDSALDEMERRGMDFVVVEGFKGSNLPKIALGGISVENAVMEVEISDLDSSLLEGATALVLSLDDHRKRPST
ncbi:MAG: molybdopterin-guanine dinucleotide biosynthesis protein B [Methanotrichaceae archaeon]|nr:molybdopterin-guanine dinucleotide biosynthesis protein B [Methanotrichaceae archaeon]